MLLVLVENGHVLYIARGHGLLLRLLVAFDRLPWPPDPWLVSVRTLRLVGSVRRRSRLRLYGLLGDPLRLSAYYAAAVFRVTFAWLKKLQVIMYKSM